MIRSQDRSRGDAPRPRTIDLLAGTHWSTGLTAAENIRDKPHQGLHALVIDSVKHLSLVLTICNNIAFQELYKMVLQFPFHVIEAIFLCSNY